MTRADLDAVLGLERELFDDEAWSRTMLEGELDQQPASRYYLIAEQPGHFDQPGLAKQPGRPDQPGMTGQPGQVIGYAGLLAAGTQADVVTIGVTSRQQGRGIGAALLGALLDEAGRRGCTEVFLEVKVENSAAQELYRSRGFAQIGVRHGYYQPSGADALVMRLDLAARPGPAAAPPATAGPSAAADLTGGQP